MLFRKRLGLARPRFARYFRKLNLQPLEHRWTPAAISGQVFNDVNGNGVVDVGDNGFSGITVFLDTDNDGVIDNGPTKSYGSGDIPKTISTSKVTVTSTLNVADIGTIADINVKMSITHSCFSP